MPAHPPAPFSLTWNQVAAFRLARHHLLDRAPAEDLPTVVLDMAGAQAQLLSAAQISLWTRTLGLRLAQVEDALSERVLVKAACMRQTLFLMPSEHLAVFVRGSAGRAEKEIQWALRKGVPERTLDGAIDAALGVLDRPLTRLEIAEKVSRALGVQMQLSHGGGWGSGREVASVPVGEIIFPVVYLLHLAAARGVVCYGPNRGNEPTFVRADAWIPRWQDVPRDLAERTLLHRYLRSYGPASAADFALWTGMTLRDAVKIWKQEQEGFAPVDVEGWAGAVLSEDLDALAQAKFERPSIRLLPYFDTFLLGHKERRHLVEGNRHADVYRAQGWIAPVVLVNGRIAAVWKHAREGNRLRIEVKGFETLIPTIVDGIQEEAQDLGRFLGFSNVDVQLDSGIAA